ARPGRLGQELGPQVGRPDRVRVRWLGGSWLRRPGGQVRRSRRLGVGGQVPDEKRLLADQSDEDEAGPVRSAVLRIIRSGCHLGENIRRAPAVSFIPSGRNLSLRTSV